MLRRRGLIAGLGLVLAALLVLLVPWFGSGPLTKDTAFIVPDGSSLAGVAAKLESEGVISSASGFRMRARLFGGGAPIRAGEFNLPKGASASRVLATIQGDEVMIKRKSTVLFQPHWHKGVVGIVASRLIDHFYRPTIVLTQSGDYVAGSARSVSGFNVYEAIHQCNLTGNTGAQCTIGNTFF